nr:hypothetical protein GCM10017611_08290 [Rhodococcus wratislaviensis]
MFLSVQVPPQAARAILDTEAEALNALLAAIRPDRDLVRWIGAADPGVACLGPVKGPAWDLERALWALPGIGRDRRGGFEVLAGCVGGGVGAGVFVGVEPDGDAVGGAWGGPVGEFASEVLTHVADAEGYKVGEDVSAGGGGGVE